MAKYLSLTRSVSVDDDEGMITANYYLSLFMLNAAYSFHIYDMHIHVIYTVHVHAHT